MEGIPFLPFLKVFSAPREIAFSPVPLTLIKTGHTEGNTDGGPETEVHAETRKRGEIQIPVKKDVTVHAAASPRHELL